MPLKEENDFLPDLDRIPKKVLQKSKLIFINYPNNPTSAVAPKKFYEEVIRIAMQIQHHRLSRRLIYRDLL